MTGEAASVPVRLASGPSDGAARPSAGARGGQASVSLEGLTILVVEDEALVALDLQYTLEDAGAAVVGPVASLSGAMQAATEGRFDAAILDIDLQGRDVFPAAEILFERGVPFVFHTGHGTKAELTASFADVPVCSKPTAPADLLKVLRALIDQRRSGH